MKYIVQFEPDDEPGWWVVTIPSVDGCITQARSLSQGEKRVREALSLLIGTKKAREAKFIIEYKIPGLQPKLKELKKLRARAEETRSKAQKHEHRVAEMLSGGGLSRRDVATIMNKSRQWVQDHSN